MENVWITCVSADKCYDLAESLLLSSKAEVLSRDSQKYFGLEPVRVPVNRAAELRLDTKDQIKQFKSPRKNALKRLVIKSRKFYTIEAFI